MKYDLIIVSKSINKQIQEMTQHCIDSARADCDLNVILVETGLVDVKYNGVNETINYRGVFNYNRALNMGLDIKKGDIHILANNDLIFYPGWSEIGELMYVNGFGSASALSQDPRQKAFNRGDFIYESYRIGACLTGWCIFVTKETILTIGKLDETFDFWYSDNMYADQIKRASIRHGLFCNIRIDHITSMTLRTLSFSNQRKYSYNAMNRHIRMKHAG